MTEGLPRAGARGARAAHRRAHRRCGDRTSTPAPPSAATPRCTATRPFDLWAIFWLPDNDTGWHDHDTSSGAVHVVAGELEEHALLVARPERRTTHGPGATFSFGPSHIHRLTCAAGRAISIHAYSPPLWRLGQYTVDGDGVLHRLSVSYADELRPLAAAAGVGPAPA